MPSGVFWRPIDQDQVLTTWSGDRQNGLVLNLRFCEVRELLASKSDIKGTHTVYFSSSIYIINKKPMIPELIFIV